MRFLAIFAAVVAVASAYSVVQTTGVAVSQWTLNDLSEALQNPATDPALKPYLVEALNELMAAVYAGSPQTSIAVVLPPMDVSSWTLQELDQALTNPSLDPALKPYLEHALNQFMQAVFAGQQVEVVSVFTPAGLIPIPAAPAPAPVIEPTPVLTESSPESSPAASPLVQIIVNVNAQQKVEDAPQPDAILPSPAIVPEAILPSPAIVPEAILPSPAIVPEAILPSPAIVPEAILPSPAIVPEAILPSPAIVPEAILPSPAIVPEAIVEMPAVPAPEPIQVAEPVVKPEPVLVAHPVVEPEPVQVAMPVEPSPNPVDIIAVSAPEVNPVDLMNPLPVAPETAGAVVVGPIV